MKRTIGGERNKSETLRDRIRGQILNGDYQDGDRLPPEDVLAESHDLSRVTVRKALDDLKAEGVVESVRGSGTRVTLRNAGYRGSLETVVLIAPAYEAFFASFLRRVEVVAASRDALVVFKHEGEGHRLSSPDLYLPFIRRHMRDFVLWPGRGVTDVALLSRLRGIGVNLVFFDHFVDTPYADCVQLDNQHAIATLHGALAGQFSRLSYIGWSDVPLSSTAEREAAFAALARPADRMFRVAKYPDGQAETSALVKRWRRSGLPQGIVCVSGDMGRWVSQSLGTLGIDSVHVACIDEIPPVPGVPIMHVAQPLDRMAARVFECLLQQNRLGPNWRGRRYTLRGVLKGAKP